MLKNILQYLERSVMEYPEKIAYSGEDISMTYQEIQNQSQKVGSCLAKTICCKNMPVLIYMEKTPRTLCAFWGVVYSGNCYVPLDSSVPLLRLENICDLLEAPLIITDEKNIATCRKLKTKSKIVLYDDLAKNEIETGVLSTIRNQMIDTDPLYIIFTSGSTGIPKGVTISHRSTIDFIENFTQTFSITSEDVLANQAPFDFDVSVKDIYSTLCTGATMHIVPRKLFILLPRLMSFFNEKRITTIIWAVSALTLISSMKGFEKEVPRFLKAVMFSGEVMPTKHLNIWKRYLPGTMFVNLYGPTEITCNCLYYIVDRDFEDSEQIPLGNPFNNTGILVLNEQNEEIQCGEVGEICVRGTSLSLGYYNNPEATNKAFCLNPLNNHYPELIYRTGDLGYYNKQGELTYASRRDHQIKHMGHRIELGEIEFAVNSLAQIEACVCLYDKVNNKILLIYQAENDTGAKYILDGIKDLLPKYMFPHEFIYLSKIPLTKNGKLDRIYLQSNYISQELS